MPDYYSRFNIVTPMETIDNQSSTCILVDHMPGVFVDTVGSSTEFKKLHYGKNTFLDEMKKFSNTDKIVSLDYQYLDDFEFLHTESFFNNIATKLVNHPEFTTHIDFNKKTNKFFYVSNKFREARLLTSCWIQNNIKDNFLHSQPYSLDENYTRELLDYILEVENIDLKREILPVKWITIDPKKERYIPEWRVYKFPNMITGFYTGFNQPYLNSVFSIVIEPVFWEDGCMLTEKYIYSVATGTIPIVNGYKVYDCIKEMGFDTFDDIINTESQHSKNPIQRIFGLLDNNRKQLEHADQIIKDPTIQKRLLSNIEVLQNYNFNLARSRHNKSDLEFLKQFNET